MTKRALRLRKAREEVSRTRDAAWRAVLAFEKADAKRRQTSERHFNARVKLLGLYDRFSKRRRVRG